MKIQLLPVLRRQHFVLLACVLFGLLLSSCDQSTTDICKPPQHRGTVITATNRGSFTVDELQNLFSLYHIQFTMPLSGSVQIMTLNYWTRDVDGNSQAVSAALYLPDTSGAVYPLISIQHGTIFKRDDAPSNNVLYSLEGLLGVLLASNGYIAIAPDGLGLGINESYHPYIQKTGSAYPVVDGIRAVRSYACSNDISFSSQVFLMGYSEGGYATMAAHKVIESDYADEITITATAPMAGPYDIRYIADHILSETTYANPGYFGYVFTTYNKVYGWNRLNDVFQSPWAAQINDLYDGTHSGEEINSILPDTVANLFTGTFLTDFFGAGEQDIKTAFDENSVNAWTASAPILLVHGSDDITVPYSVSQKTVSDMTAAGSNIRLITVPGTHVGAALTAADSALVWINSFRN